MEAWPALGRLGRGRDAGYPAPPAQTRAGAPNAHGSYLGYLAANAHSATGVEPRPGGVWHQVAPENESTSIGSSGSAGVSGGTTNEAPHYGTPSFAPGCPVRRDIGNIREPPIGATSGSPRSISSTRCTDWSHFRFSSIDSCIRFRSFCRISFSLAALRLPIVLRVTVKYPFRQIGRASCRER